MDDHRSDLAPARSVPRVRVDGTCVECGAKELERYDVLSSGGWFVVTKCQVCLASNERVPGNPFGPIGLANRSRFGAGSAREAGRTV